MGKSDALPGLRRGFALLESIAVRSGGMTFNEIGAEFEGVPSSTISRMLKVLLDEGLLVKEEGGRLYELGGRVGALARLVLGATGSGELVQPVLESLARETKESAAYFEYDTDSLRLMAKYEPAEAFHYMNVMGCNGNFHRHGFAKTCLAYLPNERQCELLEKLGYERGQALDFIKENSRLRDAGVLVNDTDDKPLLKRVSAPVLTDSGKLLGVLGISFFAEDLPDEKREYLKAEVIRAAGAAAKILQRFRIE